MLSLEDFKATKIDSTNFIIGGSTDQHVTDGGSEVDILPNGRKKILTWDSDYWVSDTQLELCNLTVTYD